MNDIINDFINIHGHKYDYSKFIYVNKKTKGIVICKNHGEFMIDASRHLSGTNCKKCMYEGGRKMPTALNKNSFSIKASIKHNNKYDYSLVEYKNNKHKVKIICPNHGEFLQRPDKHLYGEGCIKCSGTYQYTTEDFIKKSNTIHDGKYDYSKVVYINNDSKVNIICKKHGLFTQVAKDHMKGIGCTFCFESKGELMIENFLIRNLISYEKQKKFINLKSKLNNHHFRYDFYIPLFNMCIEYDGEQHFKAIKFNNISKEKANLNFERCKNNDKIKTQFCYENNIQLVRIPYTDFKYIDNILNKIFKESVY